MPTTRGFNHVATMTADLDRTVRFYEDAFDAVVVFEMEQARRPPADERRGPRRRRGAERLRGAGRVDPRGPAPPGRTWARSTTTPLAVEDRTTLEATRDTLVAAGAEVGDIQQLGDMWSLFFRDPDGMELEVCAPLSE